MAPKTEAELALQRKYELLRKKKEEKARKQQKEEQQAQKTAGQTQGLQQPVLANASKAEEAPVKALTPHEKAVQALKKASRAEVGSSGRSSSAVPGSRAGLQPQLTKPSGAVSAPQMGEVGLSPRPVEDVSKPKLSPMEAAKQALAKSKQSAPAAGRKLPGVKRPSLKRPAPASQPSAASEDGQDGPAAKRHRMSDSAGPSGREEPAPEPVALFVGDLPPFFRGEDLEALFSQLARVVHARIIAHKGFGFVTLESEAAAAYVLDIGDTQGIYAEGQPLRVSRAHDNTSDWQRGTPGDDGHHASTGAQHEEGFNPYEHPKVREARLAARSLAEQYDLAQLPGMDLGPPPERPLVCYNDL